MFDGVDWSQVVAIGLGALVSGIALANADRFPRLMRVVVAFGTTVALAALVYMLVVLPAFGFSLLGLFAVMNLFLGFVSTSAKLRVKPATHTTAMVWANEIALLVDRGWRHAGTWVVDGGQVRPTLSIVDRPSDGTQVGMMGTAAKGGTVTVETLLDDGRGLLMTIRDRSTVLRPGWMLRQEIMGASLEELLRIHDEALYYLRAHGSEISGEVAGDALEFQRVQHRKFRRFVKRRWWLWAIRPVARWFALRTVGPLHEQSSISKQLERYTQAISAEEPIGPLGADLP